jgi:hypothetical protein
MLASRRRLDVARRIYEHKCPCDALRLSMNSETRTGVTTIVPPPVTCDDIKQTGGDMWFKLVLGVALIYLAFLPPGIYSTDGNGMLAVAVSLVAHHSWIVPAELGLAGRDGQFFGKWYPLQSVLAVPFVAVAAQAAHFLRIPVHYLAAILSLVLPAIFTAGTAGLVGMISLRLGSSVAGARFAALAYAFGTIALAYARTFYAEPLLAFLTAAAIFTALACTARQIVYAALCAMLGVLAKPTGILVGPVIGVYLLAKTRSLRLSLLPGFASLAGLLLYCLYNFMRFGHPLMFGQPWSFHWQTIPEGFVGLLFSPGRGLVWYCPIIVLSVVAFRKASKSNFIDAVLPAAVFAGFLLLHACWAFWGGGWSWGPRFLLPAIPGLTALLGVLYNEWRRTLIALTVLGFLINAPTLFAFYERYYAEENEQGVSEHDTLWSFSRAPFLHAWPAAVREVQDARSADVRGLMSQRGDSAASTISSSRALRVVAIWWWVLPVAHVPRIFGAAIAVLLLVSGLILLVRAARYPLRPAFKSTP